MGWNITVGAAVLVAVAVGVNGTAVDVAVGDLVAVKVGNTGVGDAVGVAVNGTGVGVIILVGVILGALEGVTLGTTGVFVGARVGTTFPQGNSCTACWRVGWYMKVACRRVKKLRIS